MTDELNQKRIAELNDFWEHGKSFGRKHYGAMLMRDAVKLLSENENLIIAKVGWWQKDGELILPAGFTWVEVMGDEPINGAFPVMFDDEPRHYAGSILEGEAVAVFWTNKFHDSEDE